MRTAHTDEVWCFLWHRDDVTRLELTWQANRREWTQRAEHDRAGWTDPVTVDLPEPDDEDHAREIAEGYAGISV